MKLAAALEAAENALAIERMKAENLKIELKAIWAAL